MKRLYYTYIGSLTQVFLFDILWCVGTTFRGMSDISTYIGALFAALLLTLPYALTRRGWLQVVIWLLVNIWMICNLMYCRTYMRPIPLDSYMLAGNLADFTASVWDSMRWYDGLLPLCSILLGIGYKYVPRASKSTSKHTNKSVKEALYGSLAIIILFVANTALHGGFVPFVSQCYNHSKEANNPPLYYTLGGCMLYDYLTRQEEFTPQLQQKVETWLSEHKQYCPVEKLQDSLCNRRSLVLVLLESFESWPLEKTVEGKEITPCLNALLSDSSTLYAPRVLTQVGQGRSIDAQLLINAGMPPMKSKVYSMQFPHADYCTLTKALNLRSSSENSAFRSMLFSPDKGYIWNQEQIAQGFGIDTVIMEGDWVDSLKVGNGQGKLPDHALFLQVVDKLHNDNMWPIGQDAYVQVVTYTGHNPFLLPADMKTIHFKQEMHYKLNDYLTMVHYTDASLAPLLQYLKSRPDYKDMLIVITGDHEGLAGDRDPITRDPLGQSIVDKDQFTPLIILNSPIGGRYESVMGQIDIYPTLSTLLGLTDYKWQGMGESIFSPSKSPFAISTMTGKLVGDTLGVGKNKMRHIEDMREISDLIITHNAFSMQVQ